MEITSTMTRMRARVGHTCTASDHLVQPVMATAKGRTLPVAGLLESGSVAKGRIVPNAGFVADYATPTNVHRSATGSPPV